MGEHEPESSAPRPAVQHGPAWSALARVEQRARAYRRSEATPRPADPREAGVGLRDVAGTRRDAPAPRGDHPLVGRTVRVTLLDESFVGQVIAVSSDESTLRVWTDDDGRLRIVPRDACRLTD
ncbi:hypothetical protein DEU32_11456 [Curtobacterium sp. AG1037]|uniref:hypothetical protein n=1 Tax=Curtobacterium sp. AG1037 TaxID=2183990 RepID=UPI000E0B3493|nr:hypothetical protein [Curtobacterium sp. AG1037]RDH95091.1 hypothetical protein DEU32_11456 [Curtobacterium sp. AG1037]